MSGKSLQDLRRDVDETDQKILDLLNRRAEIALEIGAVKQQKKEAVYAPVREKLLLDRLIRKNHGPFPRHAVQAVFREILSASRTLQSPFSVAFLGPEATFTHLAALKYFGKSTGVISQGSIARVFDSVERGQADCGVVPIENSTEGVVGTTLDCLLESGLKIAGEITLPIAHHLLARKGSLRAIRRVYSHTQASAQCRNWLDENLPDIPLIEVDSTARAAERAAGDPSGAGIAGEHAADLYRLKIVRRHIEDHSNNMTRFLVIGREPTPQSGNDKTSILFSVKDEAGILYRMLEPFYRRRINLTKIESRPLKKKAWEYIFFLDMDGHREERRIAEAVADLEKKSRFMKVLGSYPKAT